MADENDDVVVTVDPALIEADPALAKLETKTTTTEVGGTKTAKAGADDPVESLKGQLSTLQTRTQQTERERDEARRIADEATQREQAAHEAAAAAKTEATDTQYATVVDGIEAAKAAAESAEAAYTAAFEAGNAKDAAKAQRALAEAVSRQGRLEEAKADLEATVAKRPKAGEGAGAGGDQRVSPRVTTTKAGGDPVEGFIATRTPKTQQWLRDHPDFATAISLRAVGRANTEQARLGAKLAAADNDAEAQGIEKDTPEYFEHVEKYVGLKTAAKKEAAQRRPAAPTTPVSHSGGNTSTNGQGQEVRLTKAEAAAAIDGTHVYNYDDPSGQKRYKKGDPIGIQEFARRKLLMQKEGRYDRAYLES